MLRSSAARQLARRAPSASSSSTTLSCAALPSLQSRRSNSASIGNIPPSKGSTYAMSPEAKTRLNAQSRLISGSAKKSAQTAAAV